MIRTDAGEYPRLLNKVPEVTIYFWIIKVMATTVGETAAELLSVAMGTSVGDLLAERLDLGYGQAAVVFAAMIAVVALLHYLAKMDAILSFWIAYILTRPLGASMGDFVAKPVIAGGLGWGTV